MSSIAAPRRIVDLRGFARRYQNLELLSVFDSLSAGEALLLLSRRDPESCFDELRTRRKGLFEWSPLEPEDGTRRVQVTRRSAVPGDFRRLTEVLGYDHERLQTLESQAFKALRSGDVEAARCVYRTFAYGLSRHMLLEEELVFQAFDAKTILPQAGVTVSLRAEHKEIRMLLERITKSLDRGLPGAEALQRTLVHLLGDHTWKEERVVYPAMDRLLSETEADALVASIQRFPS
jgi:uncharacterized protein (DUF2249 family)/hemerythrin superfamily protein